MPELAAIALKKEALGQFMSSNIPLLKPLKVLCRKARELQICGILCKRRERRKEVTFNISQCNPPGIYVDALVWNDMRLRERSGASAAHQRKRRLKHTTKCRPLPLRKLSSYIGNLTSFRDRSCAFFDLPGGTLLEGLFALNLRTIKLNIYIIS